MNFHKYLLLVLSSAVILNTVSCKKDSESEDTSLSFRGTLSFSLPEFVETGQVLKLTPSGVRKIDGSADVGYYWTISPFATANDTTRVENSPTDMDGSITFTVPDTLCTITFSCFAFAKDYYSSYASHETRIISLASLSDYAVPKTTFYDPRDNKVYPFATIGHLDWFARNLSYEAIGKPYANSEAAADIFGIFYTWDEAKEACPPEWRLPSNEDWASLASAYMEGSPNPLDSFYGIAGHLMVNARFNNERMWSYWPDVTIDNASSLNIIPSEYATIANNGTYYFPRLLEYASFWTADEASAGQAYYRYIFERNPDVRIAKGNKTSMANAVRCVRDSK